MGGELDSLDMSCDEIEEMLKSDFFVDLVRGLGEGDWVETDPISIPYGKSVADAVAAIKSHVPAIKIRMYCGEVPRKSKIEGLPNPCPWVDDMAYGTVVSSPPLDRDQFRDLFKSFHLAIISPEQVDQISMENLLAPLIIRSRNPFHEDDGIFGQICEEHTGEKRVAEPVKRDNSQLMDKIRSSVNQTGQDNRGDSASTLRFDNLAFHQWYMDDANFDDAQAFFCLNAMVMLTAALSTPQQLLKDLQFLLARNYADYSFRKPPPCFPKVSKKAVERIFQVVNWDDLMGTVLMIFDRERCPNRKTSDRERSFLDYLLKTAENGPRFDLCRFIERAAEDLGLPVSKIGEISSGYEMVYRSFQSYLDAKKFIEFYKKGIRYEREGRVHTFKYWAFAPFFQNACFYEIMKRRNVRLMAFCIGLSDPKHKGALNMRALKAEENALQAFYKAGLRERAKYFKASN